MNKLYEHFKRYTNFVLHNNLFLFFMNYNSMDILTSKQWKKKTYRSSLHIWAVNSCTYCILEWRHPSLASWVCSCTNVHPLHLLHLYCLSLNILCKNRTENSRNSPLNATRRGKEIENTCELLRWQRWAGKNRIRGFLRTDCFPELIDIAFAGFPTKLLADFLWREIRITSLYSNCNLTNQRMCVLGYSDYDVFLENDRGLLVYRCKKIF